MADVHTEAIRSRNMAAIRSANTKPELILRHALFARGFRYRLHDKRLPGRPDLVFPKYAAVVLIHGCFFHGHECQTFRWPATRRDFWREKIEGNRARDGVTVAKLSEKGWRVLVVWECALRGRTRMSLHELVKSVANWLLQSGASQSISGGRNS